MNNSDADEDGLTDAFDNCPSDANWTKPTAIETDGVMFATTMWTATVPPTARTTA